MKYCTYCKIFHDEKNLVYREDGGTEIFDDITLFEKFQDTKFEPTHEFTCIRCGSIYKGI